MINPKSMSHDSLVAELQKRIQEKKSGTLFISADNRRTAQINLLNGNIVALSCLNKRGVDALHLLQQLNPSWFQFIEGSSIATDRDLPSNAVIMSSLVSDFGSVSESVESTASTPQTDEMLKHILAEFMGPVAPLICNKIMRQTRNLDQAIDLLAQEIPDQQQVVEFKNKVSQQLLLLNSSSDFITTSPSTTAKNNAIVEIIPHKTRTLLKDALVDFVGPVAPLICNKVLRQARSLHQAIELLAQEIPDQQQRLIFKDQVRKNLL